MANVEKLGDMTLEELEDKLFGGCKEGLSSLVRTDGENMVIMIVGKRYVDYFKSLYPMLSEGVAKVAKEAGVELKDCTPPDEEEDSGGSQTKH